MLYTFIFCEQIRINVHGIKETEFECDLKMIYLFCMIKHS